MSRTRLAAAPAASASPADRLPPWLAVVQSLSDFCELKLAADPDEMQAAFQKHSARLTPRAVGFVRCLISEARGRQARPRREGARAASKQASRRA